MQMLKKTLCLTFGLSGVGVTAIYADQPNVLMIVVDDLGMYDLACTGSNLYETPNIDALVAQSVSFEQSYCAYPRSVPSRYSLMTGLHCARPQSNSKGDGRMLDKDSYSIAKPFKAAGYGTFYAGKWHLSDKSTSFEELGFDQSVAAGKAGAPQFYFYPFNRKDTAPADITIPLTPDAFPNEHLSDYLSRKTAAYIEEAAKGDSPFFAVCSFYAVHAPFQAKKEVAAKYAKKIAAMGLPKEEFVREEAGYTKTQQDFHLYAAMVEVMDDGVGTMINALKESGEYDNTLIVLVSDHGGLSNRGTRERALATTNAPLKAGKGHLYEGGIRVPTFIHLPKQRSSKTVSEPIINYDIFPTLVDVCGLKLAEGVNLDGVSLKRVLTKGSQPKLLERDFYWHKADERIAPTGDYISSAVRSGDYKLIDFYGQKRVELYNIAEDIGEKNNLIDREPKLAKELQGKLDAWRKEVGVIMGKPTTKGLERE